MTTEPAHWSDLAAGTTCPGYNDGHDTCEHPEGATLYLGGTAWAHPKPDALLLPTETLHLYPGNPRRGDQDEITASIRTLGFYGTIQAQESTRHVLVGNHRLRALLDLGAVLAPAEVLAVSDTVAAAIVARDNYTSDQADNDPDDLRALLERLEAAERLDLVGGLADELATLRELQPEVTPTPAGPSLSDRFLVPPFSVLDARSGVWQNRKREWLALGIQSEVGRGEVVQGQVSEKWDRGATAGVGMGDAFVPAGQGGMVEQLTERMNTRGLGAVQTNLDGVDAERYGRKPRNPADLGQGLNARRAEDGSLEYVPVAAGSGVSIFDPVLCELAYRWFSRAGDKVLDPFAGGSVRGVVAAALDRGYSGIELRGEQVAANDQQWEALGAQLGTDRAPIWHTGDARTALEDFPTAAFDLLFSCPPYADLEVYSDDPADLSAMEWPAFLEAYQLIIRRSLERLEPHRFAVWVIGEVRDPRGCYRNLVGHTVEAFEAAGARFYNEAILVTPVGSLPIRAGKQFTATRKLGKTHQQVLVFCKGDPRKATERLGDVDVAWPEGWDVTG